MKAWALFELVQGYGPLPLYKYSIEEGNDVNLPRSSVKEVYEHIIETLQEAETLLMPRTDSEYKKDMYVAVRQKPCWQRYMQRLVRLPCRVVRSLYKVVLRLDVMKMGEQQN